jgi:hypothetical protein
MSQAGNEAEQHSRAKERKLRTQGAAYRAQRSQAAVHQHDSSLRNRVANTVKLSAIVATRFDAGQFGCP